MLGFVPTPTIDLSTPTKARSRGPSRLPSVTGTTTLTSAESNVSSLTRTAISLEYASLMHTGHCPLGMYVTPTPNNLLVWDAVFFVHQGALSVTSYQIHIPDDPLLTAVRLLHGLYPQIPLHIPSELP